VTANLHFYEGYQLILICSKVRRRGSEGYMVTSLTGRSLPLPAPHPIPPLSIDLGLKAPHWSS
jgi:hypothetical protein